MQGKDESALRAAFQTLLAAAPAARRAAVLLRRGITQLVAETRHAR